MTFQEPWSKASSRVASICCLYRSPTLSNQLQVSWYPSLCRGLPRISCCNHFRLCSRRIPRKGREETRSSRPPCVLFEYFWPALLLLMPNVIWKLPMKHLLATARRKLWRWGGVTKDRSYGSNPQIWYRTPGWTSKKWVPVDKFAAMLRAHSFLDVSLTHIIGFFLSGKRSIQCAFWSVAELVFAKVWCSGFFNWKTPCYDRLPMRKEDERYLHGRSRQLPHKGQPLHFPGKAPPKYWSKNCMIGSNWTEYHWQ